MTSLFILRFIKILMVTTPFLSMIFMVLALWGIGGKTTYTDLNISKQQAEIVSDEAKNYLVNETPRSPEQSCAELKPPEMAVKEEGNGSPEKEPMPEKIDWGLVI